MTTLFNPYFGEFGGMYVLQILMPALRQLEEALSVRKDSEFRGPVQRPAEKLCWRPTALLNARTLQPDEHHAVSQARRFAARRRA